MPDHRDLRIRQLEDELAEAKAAIRDTRDSIAEMQEQLGPDRHPSGPLYHRWYGMQRCRQLLDERLRGSEQ